MARENYDLIIIGGGPAGLTAGIYAARDRLNVLLIEKGWFGGQIVNAEMVENFPGFPEGISGAELGQRMHEQAMKYGLKTRTAEATGLEINGERKRVKTAEGDFVSRALIIAGGSERVKLDVPGENRLTGKGVSYCATCDGAFFRDRAVAVIGGGDAAISEAIHLTHFAGKVTVVHRRDQLRASKIVQEKAMANPKIEFAWSSVVKEVEGGDFVSGLKLRNTVSGTESVLPVDGVFVSVGQRPNSGYLQNVVPLDPAGHVITNERMETKIAGIFAAGDIRHDSARQAITAAGDSATAAIYAGQFLSE